MDEILDLGSGTFGLLSCPQGRPRSTAVAVLNAGLIHRSGPFRLGTRLTRALAQAGYPALRFDLPGIGDALADADRPAAEVLAGVLDRVQARTGCARIVLGGICAAADASWQGALADERVTGLFLLDGLARKGIWFRLARWQRLLRKPPGAWWAALRHQLAPADVIESEILRDGPAPGSERGQFQQLLARDVQCLFLFTGGATYFLHPRQLRATYGRGVRNPAVAFEHWPECDHTYYDTRQRQRLIELVGDWLGRRFPQ